MSSFVVSFPKTGRTWLRVMLGRVLVDAYGIPEDRMLSTYKATRAAAVGPVMFSHGGDFHLLDDGPFDRLTIDERVFHPKRILYLIRDVRDTLVSFYFQQAKREKVFEGDISAFLRDERFGAPKLVRFYTMWYEQRRHMQSFKVIRYEDMHAAPVETLADALGFLELDRAGEDVVRRAVDFASFDNMKSMESQGRFARKMMQPGDPGDAESFKVRKGKVGGYVEYLGDEDLAYIDEVIARHGDESCDWYFCDHDQSSPATPAEAH
ncbi:MAG: sulfotransferase domain-containing protein [Planctomycetota bacterium]